MHVQGQASRLGITFGRATQRGLAGNDSGAETEGASMLDQRGINAPPWTSNDAPVYSNDAPPRSHAKTLP